MGIAETKEQVLNLEGEFDASAFSRVLGLLQAAPLTHFVIDFRAVRCIQIFALAKLVELAAHSSGAIELRGLCQQQFALLRYLGLDNDSRDPAQTAPRLEHGRPATRRQLLQSSSLQ